ncbi:hypothetical protein T265_09585 [Opisthorchis viverrini]|uniref:Uncharacterized protein n=1 Tax=Opisthorchis viverrini TaxID=6198 RepID=A0A074ZGB5_OPIVI|nr:hypothetical protein T265_09585 [Opisthorchis viverrini]KER22300.1 hypothetical protein T265_09585 [Opisthorchis viverrini]
MTPFIGFDSNACASSGTDILRQSEISLQAPISCPSNCFCCSHSETSGSASRSYSETSRDSTESLVYDILQLNVLHTGRLMIQLARYSRYRLPDEPQEGRNRSWAVEEFSATFQQTGGCFRQMHSFAYMGDPSESLVYDVLQLNILHKVRLMIQLISCIQAQVPGCSVNEAREALAYLTNPFFSVNPYLHIPPIPSAPFYQPSVGSPTYELLTQQTCHGSKTELCVGFFDPLASFPSTPQHGFYVNDKFRFNIATHVHIVQLRGNVTSLNKPSGAKWLMAAPTGPDEILLN